MTHQPHERTSSLFEHIDQHTSSAPLSAAGRARRDAMLEDLQHAVVNTARRRRAIRAGAILAAPALALAITLLIFNPSHAPQPIAQRPTPPGPTPPSEATGRTEPDVHAPAAPVMHHATFRIVQSPPSAQIVTHPSSRVQMISDDELLAILRANGHDVGLIRTDDRVILTDNTPATAPPGSSRGDERRDDPGIAVRHSAARSTAVQQAI